MFWGLTIEPGKRYMQTVGKSFHLSMACLELNPIDNDAVTLMLDYEGQEYVLCNLHRHKVMQCQLDLNFQAGEKVAFYSAGKSRVHLSGYLVEEDIELTDDEEEEEDEEEATPVKSPQKKRKEAAGNIPGNKKQKLNIPEDSEEEDDEMDDTFEGLKEEEDKDDEEDEDEEDEDEEDDDDDDDDDDSDEQQSMNSSNMFQKKKDVAGKSPKTPNQQNGQLQTPQSGKKNKNKQLGESPKTDSPQSGTPQKKVLQGGVVVHDVKVGNGPVAKPGKQVSVYYVGRLKQNNKQFDSSTGGPGFKFNLGRSEVIKGWDIGVAGMRVGGKRTITVPPQMAYGKKGQPPVIPPNSVLVFDVELRNIH